MPPVSSISNPKNDSPNVSLDFSGPHDYRERTRIQFQGWRNPHDEISQWYQLQPFHHFQTIQYRKERSGIQHEFILALLQNDEGHSTGSFCRFERAVNPLYQRGAIGENGTIAHDYVQTFDSYKAEFIEKDDHDSDILAEIMFPSSLDLRDILAICYSISEHPKSERYPLQQYNCYFFSWTIVLCLARFAVGWEKLFNQHLKDIQNRILQSITDLDPTKTNKLSFILSRTQNTATSNHSQSWLDSALKLEICGDKFSSSVRRSLRSKLWEDRRLDKIKHALKSRLHDISNATISLVQTVGKPVDSNEKLPVGAAPLAFDRPHLVGPLAAKMVAAVFEACLKGMPYLTRTLKQNLEQAMKKLQNGDEGPTRSSTALAKTTQWALSAICGPGILGLIIFACLHISIDVARLKVKGGNSGRGRVNKLTRIPLIVGLTAQCFSRHLPSMLGGMRLTPTFSKAMYVAMLEGRQRPNIIPDEKVVVEISPSLYYPAMDLLSKELHQLLIEHGESNPDLPRLVALEIYDRISKVGPQFLLRDVWREILFYDLSDVIAQATLDALVSCTSIAVPPKDNFVARTSEELSWSHPEIQDFIRGRISSLSKRKIKHAAIAKFIPSTTPHLKTQEELEDAIEAIWCTCGPLMGSAN